MELEDRHRRKLEELWRKHYLETKDLSDGWRGVSRRIAVEFAEYVTETEEHGRSVWNVEGTEEEPARAQAEGLGASGKEG